MNRLSNKKFIGLVGVGYWGKNLARVLDELEVLKMLCDTDREILKQRKKEYPHLDATDDFSKILQNEEIQGVVIVTPPDTHYKLAKEALEKGKDVFVEKPLSLNIKEGEALIQLARNKKCVLMTGHILLYHPAIIALKKLIEENQLGEIHHIWSSRLNLGKVRKVENILWSFAPHDISVMIDILGIPKRVSTVGGAYLQKDIADITLSTLEFNGRKVGHILVSWFNPFKEQKLTIISSKAMVLFDDRAKEKLVLYPYTVNWHKKGYVETINVKPQTIPIALEEPLKNEVLHFLSCIKERTNPKTDGEEALAVLKVLEASQRSLEHNGKPQKII